MTFWTILCVTMLAVSMLQAWYWFRSRRPASALLGAVFGFVYFGDLAWITMHATTYITVSDSGEPATDAVIIRAILICVSAWVVFSIFQLMRMPRAKVAGKNFYPDYFGYLFFLSSGLIVGYGVLSLVASVGVSQAFELRQIVFGGSLFSMMTYYIAPILSVIGFVLIRRATIPFKPIVFIVFMLSLASAVFTGSRSGIFLTGLLPIIILMWRRSYLEKSNIKKLFVLVLMFMVPTLGGRWFLETARGVTLESSRATMDSVDISQADVLIRLIAGDAGSSESTYLGSLFTLLPRVLWPDKPYPANVVASEVLAPERYNLTGSEITSGLIGEGFINFGLLGFVSSAFALFLFCRICDSLFLGWENEYVACLALLITFRGINLIRGDMANVVAPTIIALVIWGIIFGRTRVASNRSNLQKSF